VFAIRFPRGTSCSLSYTTRTLVCPSTVSATLRRRERPELMHHDVILKDLVKDSNFLGIIFACMYVRMDECSYILTAVSAIVQPCSQGDFSSTVVVRVRDSGNTNSDD